jgi:hypothetical protein
VADIRSTLRSAEEEEAVPSVPIHELSNSTRDMLKAQRAARAQEAATKEAREAAAQQDQREAPLVPAESARPAPPPPEKQVPPLVPTIIRHLGAAPGQAGLRPQTPNRSLLPWWAFAVIAAMLVGLIWLVRYLRFG